MMGANNDTETGESGETHMNEKTYLADWRAILERRAEQVAESFCRVEGVRALIVGGSLGGGKPWPLSDIDIIPIYDRGREAEANERVKELRQRLMERWETEGWKSSLDVGTLYLTADSVAELVRAGDAEIAAQLDNLSVYHILDKAYGGRAVYDPDRIGVELLRWIGR